MKRITTKRRGVVAGIVAPIIAAGLLFSGGAAAQAREWTHCASGRVCVYEHNKFDGTYQFWNQYASSYGVLNDRVSSLVNRVGNSTDFYTGSAYTGTYITVPATGIREDLRNYGKNDVLSSHRPR